MKYDFCIRQKIYFYIYQYHIIFFLVLQGKIEKFRMIVSLLRVLLYFSIE